MNWKNKQSWRKWVTVCGKSSKKGQKQVNWACAQLETVYFGVLVHSMMKTPKTHLCPVDCWFRTSPWVHTLGYSSLRWQGTSVQAQMVLLLEPNISSLSEHLWQMGPGSWTKLISSTPPLKGTVELQLYLHRSIRTVNTDCCCCHVQLNSMYVWKNTGLLGFYCKIRG